MKHVEVVDSPQGPKSEPDFRTKTPRTALQNQVQTYKHYEIQFVLSQKNPLPALKKMLAQSNSSRALFFAQAQYLIKHAKGEECQFVLARNIGFFLRKLTLKQMSALLSSFPNEENRLICFENLVESFPNIEGDFDLLLEEAFQNDDIRAIAEGVLEQNGIVVLEEDIQENFGNQPLVEFKRI